MTDAAPDLPPLYEGRLDRGTLAALFLDLETCADVLEVRVKGAAGTHAEAVVPLDVARRLLDARAARGVQVTYRFEDVTWMDTLLADGGDVRLVRIVRQEEAG